MHKKGVCCYCQSVHPVIHSCKPSDTKEDPFLCQILHEPCEDYIMAPHKFNGSDVQCQGSGQEPQILVKGK